MSEIVRLGTAHVALVVDRSGSMAEFGEAPIRGVNQQVDALRASAAGVVRVSLLLFADTLPTWSYQGIDLGRVLHMTRAAYYASGGTALYDAVHASIDALEPEIREYETALVVIVTDGDERDSRRSDAAELARRIRAKQETGRWTFVLVGPQASVGRTAEQLGIPAGNVRPFELDKRALEASFDDAKRATARYMDARARGVAATDGFFLPPKVGG